MQTLAVEVGSRDKVNFLPKYVVKYQTLGSLAKEIQI